MSQLAVDNDNAKTERYYKRDRSKRVRITWTTDVSVWTDLREYVLTSGLPQQDVIETALVSYLSGSY